MLTCLTLTLALFILPCVVVIPIYTIHCSYVHTSNPLSLHPRYTHKMIFAFLSLLTVAAAIRVTSPSSSTVWASGTSAQTITWEAVSSDPTSFTIQLVNQVSLLCRSADIRPASSPTPPSPSKRASPAPPAAPTRPALPTRAEPGPSGPRSRSTSSRQPCPTRPSSLSPTSSTLPTLARRRLRRALPEWRPPPCRMRASSRPCRPRHQW